MELDELKNISKQKKAPEMKTSNLNASSSSIDDLITQIKKIDTIDRKTIIGILIFFMILIVLSYFMGTFENSIYFLSLGFLFLFIRYFQLIKIDYNAPSILFLKKAEDRYKFLRTQKIGLFVLFYGLLFILLVVVDRITSHQENLFNSIIGFFIMYSVVMSASLIAGKIDWNRKKKPVYEKILELRKDFEKNI